MTTLEYLRQVWSLVRPYRVRLFLGVLCGVLSGLANGLLVVSVKLVVDTVFPTAGSGGLMTSLQKAPGVLRGVLDHLAALLPKTGGVESPVLIVLVVSTIPLAMLLRGGLTYLNIYFMSWVSCRAISDLRVRLYSHLLSLSLSFFNRTTTGELITRINDASVIQNTISAALATIIREPITIVALLALLFSQQAKLTFISMLVLPLCVIPVAVYGRKVRKSARAFQAESIGLSELIQESFTGYRIVKAYNLEQTLAERFRQSSRQFVNFYMRIVRATDIPGPMIEFAGSVGVALLILYISFVTKQTPGDFLQFVLSLFLVYAPIKTLTRLHSQVQQSRILSDGIFALLKLQPTVLEPASPKPLRAAGAPLQFDHVSFDYGDKPVLQDINLTVRPGQLVALVGASGSGKTTLTNLLLRFYDPKQGAIRIGGVDLREVTTHSLRAEMAIVTQETILFNDTIRRNIELGRPGATDAEIEQAARHAYAYDFIMERPQGFETVVGERGMSLSGGQRQRLAIARAILRNAPILILDEATSALDTESERAVQAALDDLMQNRTTLCIAHRLSTIQHADLIVVLSEGRIVETGNHEELVRRGGHYQKLHALQFKA